MSDTGKLYDIVIIGPSQQLDKYCYNTVLAFTDCGSS